MDTLKLLWWSQNGFTKWSDELNLLCEWMEENGNGSEKNTELLVLINKNGTVPKNTSKTPLLDLVQNGFR